MSRFLKLSRKTKSPGVPSPASDRTKQARRAEKENEHQVTRRNNATKQHSSPPDVSDETLSDDDNVEHFSGSEEGSFSEGSFSESSFDDETYLDDENDLVGMLKSVFSGPNDVDSDNDSNDDGSSSQENKAYKLCYRLSVNDATLKELDLEIDTVQNRTAKDIADAFPSNTRLQRLCLTCGSDKHKGKRNLRSLAFGLRDNSSITEVDLLEVELDRDSASWLGTALSHNSVRKISLKSCKFKDAGLAILFLGMQHNKFEEIHLSQIDLAGSSSEIVSASLPFLNLKAISLIDANLSINDLSFLCDNIKKTPSLKSIDVSHNKLEKEGIVFLGDIFRRKEQQISTLILSSCSLDDCCVSELTKSLLHSLTVARVDLSQNDISDQGAFALKKLLGKNSSIKELRVDGCQISQKRLKAIEDGLRYNNSILKSFGFSATTSLAILHTGDAIEEMSEQITSSVTEMGEQIGSSVSKAVRRDGYYY